MDSKEKKALSETDICDLFIAGVINRSQISVSLSAFFSLLSISTFATRESGGQTLHAVIGLNGAPADKIAESNAASRVNVGLLDCLHRPAGLSKQLVNFDAGKLFWLLSHLAPLLKVFPPVALDVLVWREDSTTPSTNQQND